MGAQLDPDFYDRKTGGPGPVRNINGLVIFSGTLGFMKFVGPDDMYDDKNMCARKTLFSVERSKDPGNKWTVEA